MAKTIYLVKKDPESSRENTEWIQMNGKEFYQFIHSTEGKRRYFIHLTDDISYEADEIYIEASYGEYQEWYKEARRHRYLAECAKDTLTLSADTPVGGGEELLIDTIRDNDISIEERVVNKEMLEKLREAVNLLSADEMIIIQTLYYSERVVTEGEAGKILGMSQQTLHYRKKKIFSKIAKILFVKF